MAPGVKWSWQVLVKASTGMGKICKQHLRQLLDALDWLSWHINEAEGGGGTDINQAGGRGTRQENG